MAVDELMSKQVPYSIEAEQAVLSGVLLKPEMLHEIIDQVSDADFTWIGFIG